MHYFFIALSSLIVTTNSPKDCEDGFFTGYILSLSMFSVCVCLKIISYAIIEGYKIKTEYYSNFFSRALTAHFIIVYLNFMGNFSAANDCGFYSLRGFAASLITLSSVTGLIIFMLLLGL
jgi:hypothetical protein